MIQIIEDTPIKVSGRTSIFIFCDSYNKDVVDAIKSLDLAVYHKKKNVWEIPVNFLSEILDKLTYLDEIKLILLADDKQLENKGKITISYKTNPFKHQEEAIIYGLENNDWLLLDSPGLGKTCSIIHLAEELKAQRGLKHCLIVCGIATLRSNWEKEIKIHSYLSSVIIGKKINSRGTVTWNTIAQRAEQLKNNIDEFFVIINVESLRDERVVDAINNSQNKFDMIVLDECHSCKGAHAEQSQNLLKLNKATYKIGLTGTLIMNNPLDSFIPLKWIGKDHSTLTNFKKLYCEYGGFGGHQIIGFKNLDILKDELNNCSLRRTKDLMSLPPKNIIDEYIEMNDEHRKFYEDVKKGVKEECDKVELKASNTLALTTRLRQASTCPSVLTSNPIVSSKFERCLSLVEEITSQGDKVVIMSNFKESVYELEKLLSDYNPLIGTGDIKDNIVSDNIDKFQQDPKYKVFIATNSKCGTGITLNRARYMIVLDAPWTYAVYTQITDRIHRINNTESVFIYNLICEDTIDIMVSKILNRKKAVSGYIVDDQVDDDAINMLKNYILDLD